jgi:hypothetical protein
MSKMALRVLRQFIVSLLAILPLVSCTKGTHYYLFNNAGEPVDVVLGSFKTSIAPGEREQLTEWISNPGPLIIYTHSHRWEYAVQFDFFGRVSVNERALELPFQEFARSAFFTDDFWFQTEPDGTVCPIPKHKNPGDPGISGGPYCIPGTA